MTDPRNQHDRQSTGSQPLTGPQPTTQSTTRVSQRDHALLHGIACPPDDGGGVPRLLWTDPWPHGQRHLDTVRADASNLTRLLFGYAMNALPGWMSARAIRHVTGPAPPTDALRRIRLAGWTVAHRSSWLLTCSSPPGAAPLDTADQVLCCLNLGAYACVMGRGGTVEPEAGAAASLIRASP